MIGFLFILAVVAVWSVVSLAFTWFSDPMRWYSWMSTGRFRAVAKFVPVPCFVALMDWQEHRSEEEWKASLSRDKVAKKRNLRLRRTVDKAFLFSLPERLEFRHLSQVCAASSFENATTRDFRQSQWLKDTSKTRVHGCHDLGYLPERIRFSHFIRDVMGYDNLTNLFSYQDVHYTAGKVRGKNKKNVDNVKNPSLFERTRVLIQSCQSFEEADAVAAILLRQVYGGSGAKESQERLVERNLLSDANIAVVVTRFRERVREFPEVPMGIHVEMALSSLQTW